MKIRSPQIRKNIYQFLVTLNLSISNFYYCVVKFDSFVVKLKLISNKNFLLFESERILANTLVNLTLNQLIFATTVFESIESIFCIKSTGKSV